MRAVGGIDAARSDMATYDRHAHGHRLQNLVLGPARDAQRSHSERGPTDVGPHVRDRTGDRNARTVAQLSYCERRIGSNNLQLDRRPSRLDARPV